MSNSCTQVLTRLIDRTDAELRRLRSVADRPLNLLDVGCWDGNYTERYRQTLGGSARGVEVFPEKAEQARARGIDVATVDLETGVLPWPDGSVDVVVANQVFEHLKNIWNPMCEVARVIAPGGAFVFSVPNLGSLHNRVMLGLGLQPTSIRVFGPHIRGFTYRDTRAFLEFGGFFRIERVVGVGFYPFPAATVDWLADLWVGASHTPLFVARRVAPAGTLPPWAQMRGGEGLGEFTFYGGVAEKRES
jgi:SAM-dependent methyltransferase